MNDYSQLDKQSETYDQAIITPEELDNIDNGTINTETILDADIGTEDEVPLDLYDAEATPSTEVVVDDNTPILGEEFAIEPFDYDPNDYDEPQSYDYDGHDVTSYEGKMSFLEKIHQEVFGK